MSKITFTILLLPFLFACESLPTLSKIITPYKADMQQGSVLDEDKIKQLKIGMTKTQVQELIGSPSIIDPFHNTQWDYVNHSTLHQKDNISYRLTLKFDEETLTDINNSAMKSLPKITP